MISRHLIVSVVVIIADGAWAYVALAMLGFVFVQDAAPLTWPLIILLLSLGALIRTLGDGPKARRLAFGIGLVVTYVAGAVSPIFKSMQLMWLLDVVQGKYSFLQVIGIVLTLVGAGWSWRRGMTLAHEVFLEDRTGQVFRIGLVVLVGALLLEVISGRDLGTASFLMPFFLASLAAIALARMPDVTQASGNWIVVVASTVVLTIALGLLAGLLFSSAGRGGVALISAGWDHIVEFVVSVVAALIITVVAVLIAAAAWLSMDGNRERHVEPIFVLPDWVLKTQEQGMTGELGAPDYWPYLLGAFIAYVLYRTLKPSLSSRFRRAPPDEVSRETLNTQTQSINDWARLLKILLGMNTTEQPRPAWQYPRGRSGISEVFELYFEMLDATMQRGGELSQSATPLEQTQKITATLPGVPVTEITQCFNGACYGQLATEPAVLAALKDALRSALDDQRPGTR